MSRPDAATTPARRSVSWVWALLPLLLALPAAPCFAWAAWRLRSRALAVEAAAYAGLTVLFFAWADGTGPISSDQAGGFGIVLMLVATGRALAIRRRVFAIGKRPSVTDPAQPAAAGQAAPVGWAPTLPATPPVDPAVPATWHTPFTCTGNDRHQVGVSAKRMILPALAGALLLAGEIHAHLTGRPLGFAIGLLILPPLTAMFERRVDGPVLHYRNWGVGHDLRLDQVTHVGTRASRGGLMLTLTTPDLPKPVWVSLGPSVSGSSQTVRQHLRMWLEHPGASITPVAHSLLAPDLDPTGGGRRKRSRAILATSWALGFLAPVGVAVWLLVVVLNRPDLGISGAPGYTTYGGEHGKPLAVHQPWGTPCQPLRFTVEAHVPDAVYQQLAAVVSEARRFGLNVTLESRGFTWDPQSVFYPPGTSPATVPRVPLFSDDDPPPTLSGGRPERIHLGWDTRLDGHHEDLTYVQGHVHLAAVQSPQALRTVLREFVAFAEGVGRTSRESSGVWHGAAADEFTASDVHAIELMSGCDAYPNSLPSNASTPTLNTAS